MAFLVSKNAPATTKGRAMAGRKGQEEHGAAAGRRWACEVARYEQLERLVYLGWVTEVVAGKDAFAELCGLLKLDQAEEEPFAVDTFDTKRPSAAAVAGFVRGASEGFTLV